jgi:hypothetical protein
MLYIPYTFNGTFCFTRHFIAPLFNSPAGLAQSVERKTLNLKAAGSTPAFGYS